MRLHPLLLGIALSAASPAAAELMEQRVCDKLAPLLTYDALAADALWKVIRNVDTDDVAKRLGPKNTEAMMRVKLAMERLDASIRDFSAAANESAKRLKVCSE